MFKESLSIGFVFWCVQMIRSESVYRISLFGSFFLMSCSLIFQRGGSNQWQALISILDWLVSQVGVWMWSLPCWSSSCEESLHWAGLFAARTVWVMFCAWDTCEESGPLGWAGTPQSVTLLSLLYSYQIFGVFSSVRSTRFTESSVLCSVTHESVGFFNCLFNFDKMLLLYI